MTPEGKVVAAIKKAVKELGGETRKMTWVGHAGAPDLCILLPEVRQHILVEVKAPGEKPKPHQFREHEKLRDAGFLVWVTDDVCNFLWRLAVENGWADHSPCCAFAYKAMAVHNRLKEKTCAKK